MDDVNWEAVYQEQLPRVYNYMRYRVGNDMLAEDLTAATFAKAWRARMRYRSDLGAFTSWLFSIARRVVVDHLRRHRDEVPLEEADDVSDGSAPDEAFHRDSELSRLRALLNSLPAREQELIALKYGGGLTNRAVAQLTGLSESNVGTILYRVVHKLRTEWEEER